MSVSLAPAGTAGSPRAAADWIRHTALPALELAAADTERASESAAGGFAGVTGGAYAGHVHDLLFHVDSLQGRLLRAASLFEAYADRLAAHESLLDDLARRAVASGLQVIGDQVLPPTDVTDLDAALTWTDIGAITREEQRQLAEWVRIHLEAAVDSFDDEQLTEWAAAFLGLSGSTLVAAASTMSLTKAGQLATRLADQLTRVAKIPGPVGLAYDTVVALRSDEPAEGIWKVVGGFGTATVAVATLPATATGAAVVGVSALATIGGVLVADKAWDRLPDEATEVLEEAAVEAIDEATDWAGDRLDDMLGWLPG